MSNYPPFPNVLCGLFPRRTCVINFFRQESPAWGSANISSVIHTARFPCTAIGLLMKCSDDGKSMICSPVQLRNMNRPARRVPKGNIWRPERHNFYSAEQSIHISQIINLVCFYSSDNFKLKRGKHYSISLFCHKTVSLLKTTVMF